MAAWQGEGLPGRRMEIGRVFGRAFGAIGANPVVIFGIALLFGAIPSALVGFVAQPLQLEFVRSGQTGLTVLSGLVSGLSGILFMALTQGGLVRAVAAQSEGRRAGFGECALAGLGAALPLFAVGLIVGLGSMLGLVLLIVPGIMLYIMWSVAAPAVVAEGLGPIAALGRSRRLTKGARWNVFGLQLIVVVFYYLVSAVVGVALVSAFGVSRVVTAATAAGGFSPGAQLFAILLSTLLTAMWSAIQTALYVELREWKDGPASERLADIFA